MAAYYLENGKIQAAYAGYASREDVEIYHLSANGEITTKEIVPNLKPGEGLLMCTEGFYVEPLEIQVDFLKAADAERWIKYMALRHIERARYIDDRLWVLAEIMEEKI